MITYQRLQRHPEASSSLIGMNLAAFEQLYQEFAPRHQGRRAQATVTRRSGTARKRAAGGGRKATYALQDRLLMTLFWLRVYTTYAVLGFLYDLDKTNIEDTLKDVLATLDTMSEFTFERPSAERVKLRTAQAVMDAFPAVRLVIDAKEQRIQRPHAGRDNQGQRQDKQKPYYSGKKKTHTLKNQFAVRPDGYIEAVSSSVPGSTHDLTLLRQSNLLDHLDAAQAAMLDKGYDGIRNDYPALTLYHPHKARRNHPLTDDQKADNRHLSKYRIVIEHTLAQVSQFQVLAQLYRHARDRHSQLVRIVSALVNRRIHTTPLKTYATA
jgi:transposase